MLTIWCLQTNPKEVPKNEVFYRDPQGVSLQKASSPAVHVPNVHKCTKLGT